MSYFDKALSSSPGKLLTTVMPAIGSSPAIQNSLIWRQSGIPFRLWGYSLAEYVDRYPDVGQLSEWVQGFPQRHALDDNGYPADRDGYGRGLFLYGSPATGKTTAACAVLTSFRKLHKLPVYFARWDNYLKARQALMRGDAPSTDESGDFENTVVGVESFDLVALDDVGHEYSSGSRYGETQLDQVIRSRYDRGLPTIITTNLSESAWTQRYDATLTSFIKRACTPMKFVSRHAA